ncbi:NAD(P)-binding protein [Macrolepiota fuliginosa MF-IS2]|uniref:NAD(P)-binding protein n=1 Tax=Macrolepiota fuliginosa MF-IS2 TaxID=1400762 RepID=A0A9P5XQW1_9AGAR|nr:NAD(P)-binding protein [Macrolepiota fuliginosa MF-IS2]
MPGIEESKCILVTGATAGIGRALALSLAKLPSNPQVIAAGRRQDRLEELKRAGLEIIQFDLDTDASSLKSSVDLILEKYPNLDAVILNAGVQYEFDFKKEINIAKLQSELNINYTSVVTTIAYLTPHFLKLSAASQPSFIIPVTAGLGIVPAVWVPGYSASKAALHSYTTSLRLQLNDTNIHVLEIIPPLVESELHDAEGTTEKLTNLWMPLDKYTEVTMQGLRNGDTIISTGGSLVWYDKYDKDKEGVIAQLQAAREKW